MAHTIATKYNPVSGKITAKCWRARAIIDGYYSKAVNGDLDAHRAAADALLVKINKDTGGGAWVITASAEGIKANEYTFIIDYKE